MKEFTVHEEQNLKDFTDTHYAQASFYWSALIREREIKVNGVRAAQNIRLFPGDKVAYYLTPKQEEKKAFEVVYKDEDVVIADKESGVNSEAVFCELSARGNCAFIHRLDRNTCGLMIFARNSRAEEELLAAFRERRVRKIYHALCLNRFKRPDGILRAYLKKYENRSSVRIFPQPTPGAEEILTEYKIMKVKGEYAKVKVGLHTGKTHQIRAHLAYIGCPILGDEKYGLPDLNRRLNLKRQCLVAKELHFEGLQTLSRLNGKIFTSAAELDLDLIGDRLV